MKLTHLRLEKYLIGRCKREFNLFIKSLLEFLVAAEEAHGFAEALSLAEFKVLEGREVSNIDRVEGESCFFLKSEKLDCREQFVVIVF